MPEKSLTIPEIRELKRKCESDIIKLLSDFQNDTSLDVKNIKTSFGEMYDGNRVLLGLKIEVDL